MRDLIIKEKCMMEFNKLRNELDIILDDYEYLKEENALFQKMSLTYMQMKDLLTEMKSFGDLDGYDVEDIFKGIEENEKLGI